MAVQWAFEVACERTPSRLAVVQGSIRWSFGDLWEHASKLARVFTEKGLVVGDRVLVGLRNTPENVAVFFATQMNGLVYVPINYRVHASSVQYFWQYSGASLGILESDLIEGLLQADPFWVGAQAADNLWIGDSRLWERTHGTDRLFIQPQVDDGNLSMILFTSGTTGKPKGVPLTHGNVLARTLGPSLNWDCPHDAQERVLGIMPLYHTIGLQACLLYGILQNHTYYPVAQFSPASTLKLIESERITHVFGTPTHLYALVTEPTLGQIDTSSLTHILYGGAPMSPYVIQGCAQRLCSRITYVYGNTETYNALYHREAARTLEQSVGGIYHRVRVVEIGGTPDQLVDRGHEGELIIDVRSPESFKGYWNLPEKTGEKVKEGWYFSGDSCRWEGENTYRVTGRVDDMIISGGENIQPVTVENALLGHPDVLDVAVAGIPDEHWGQKVKAYVVTRNAGLAVSDLDQWVKTRSTLDPYMRPRSYQFVADIPRNPSGKILRQSLNTLDQNSLGEALS